MKKISAAIFLLMLCGCSTAAQKPFPLEVVEPHVVAKCRQVGKYPGPGGYRMWGPPAVPGSFKYETALKAKEKGATHIYWREDVDGIDGNIVGNAFDCTGVELEDNWSKDE
jgi:hypothetical protein